MTYRINFAERVGQSIPGFAFLLHWSKENPPNSPSSSARGARAARDGRAPLTGSQPSSPNRSVISDAMQPRSIGGVLVIRKNACDEISRQFFRSSVPHALLKMPFWQPEGHFDKTTWGIRKSVRAQKKHLKCTVIVPLRKPGLFPPQRINVFERDCKNERGRRLIGNKKTDTASA